MQIKPEKLSFSDVDDTDEESDGQPASISREQLEKLKELIKQEKRTSSEDDSDSSEPTSPNVATARVKSEPPERDPAPSSRSSVGTVAVKIEPSGKSPRANDTVVEPLDDLPSNISSISDTGFPPPLQSKLVDYLQRFPNVRPTIPASNQGSAVELDLSNPDEEAWIVQCPATIDPHVVLLNRKLNLSAPQATVKKCPIPLETTVRRNTAQQVISVLSESQMKSFVPAGFIRITEPLPEVNRSEQLDQEGEKYREVRVPFPDDIRERHPLLGYDFQTQLAIPDRVQKRLSFARQKADLFYTLPQLTRLEKTNHGSSTSNESHPEPVTTKTRKRKAAQENVATKMPSTVGEIVVKEEPTTPTKKKRRNEAKQAVAMGEDADRPVVAKQEVTEATEDDISWLLNI
ncbi:uncharacterized protein LOC126581216 [Anopheles aquasalis]|uniref:uncharacterized protein LOC126581216 n=1 Tax=Anopheles aquasalis TaxID=42839 RepID=UPI00215A739D|nr:uncharacterized protein LOC126581216 [Anopheles aquasalis]